MPHQVLEADDLCLARTLLRVAAPRAEVISRLALEHLLVLSNLPTLDTQPELAAAHSGLFSEVSSRIETAGRHDPR